MYYSWPISDWLEPSRCPQRRTRMKLSPCGTVRPTSFLDRRNTRHQSTCGTGGASYFVLFLFYDSHSVAAAAAIGCHWHIPCRGNSRRAKEGCLVRVASSLDRFALATSPGAVAWQPSFTSLLEEEKYYKCHWQLELMSLCLLLLLGAWVAFSLKWLAVDRSSPVPQSKTSCS